MQLQELRPGLWRWTARHPEWESDQPADSPGDWPPDVGCVAYAAPRALVLIDPLVVADWAELDRLAAGRRVVVLRTIAWHERSRKEAIARYGATTRPPAGVHAIRIPRARETMYWIPEHRALVPGDRLIGFPQLRVCPDSWLRYLEGITGAELRESLRPLLDLPVELVLVSHGDPVLENAHEELARAIHAPSAA
jgi:hypothetical protein